MTTGRVAKRMIIEPLNGILRGAIACILIILLIVPSAFSPSAVNWAFTNGTPEGTNFSDQTQLNQDNFGSLSLRWAYPFPASGPVTGLSSVGQGAIAPPLVYDGVLYVVMNDLEVLALNAADGSLVWRNRASLNTTGLPLGQLSGHVHGLTYYRGDVWLSLPDCSALALNALTGSQDHRIGRICSGIDGNEGKYDYSGAPITFLGNIMIWTASSVSEGTDAGRGFVAGYNISDGRLLWRWYVTPPAGGDPTWDTESCAPPCRGNVAPFRGDWGSMGTTGGATRAGAAPSWGQPAVDPKAGIVFVSTSQPSPDWNATYRPGPNLYADSVVALDATNGKMLWFFQATPHDLYDFDCGWNVVLGNVTSGGSSRTAVFKACKNGYVYALDAGSGALLWYFDPPSLRRLNTANANYVASQSYNSTLPWLNFPSRGAFKQCPGANGGIESDISFAYGKVFVATHNFCTFGIVTPVTGVGGTVWGASGLSPDTGHANTTIYALDASSGKVSWSHFVPGVPYRGWLTATGGMVIASTLGGEILALDAFSGRVDGSLHIGASLYEGVTMGTDSSGSLVLFQLLSSSSYGAFSGGVPGVLFAFGLPSRAATPWIAILPWVVSSSLAVAIIALLVRGRSRSAHKEAASGLSRIT